MATYGISTNGFVQFTGYTNTLAQGAANAAGTTGFVQFNGITQFDAKLAQIFRNGAASAASTSILLALLGVAPGAMAVKQKKQIKWEQGSPGGVIPIETINTVNRATTANDQAAWQALINRQVFPASYAPDLSGNGGGGKVAY